MGRSSSRRRSALGASAGLSRCILSSLAEPNQNAYIERFNRTYRREVLDACLFASLADVRLETEAWLTTYTTERPHDSLGQVPPLTFLPRPTTPEQSSLKLSA